MRLATSQVVEIASSSPMPNHLQQIEVLWRYCLGSEKGSHLFRVLFFLGLCCWFGCPTKRQSRKEAKKTGARRKKAGRKKGINEDMKKGGRREEGREAERQE